MSTTSPLRASALYYAYGELQVIFGADLEIPSGRVTAIAGPNGAGKSTLIELLAGVRAPDSGVVEAHARVALVVQRPSAPDELPLTARDVVALGAAAPNAHGTRADRRARVIRALERVGADGFAAAPFAELSGGQRQRVLIAQGLAVGAGVLLLDEPAAGLDEESRRRTRDILGAEAARGVAVACVTHDHEDLAAADRIIRLEAGRTSIEGAR